MVTSVSNSNASYITGNSRGFSEWVLFKGSVSDLPTTYPNGTPAYCFAGTDKGKVFILDAEEPEWVEQEL